MPDENIKTTLQFQADITDFKAAMQEANRAIKLANSEFKAASSGMDDWANSTDGLSAKLRQLSTVQAAEQKKLEALKASYAKVVKEQGANSTAAQELQIKINNQQATVNKVTREYNSFAAKLDDVKNAAGNAKEDIKKAGDAAKDAGNSANEASGGWSIMKDVIADFVSNVIQNAIDALANLAEATRDYRREMALMAQNASDSGADMEAMRDSLSDVAAVTGDVDAAMEGINMLMATGMDTSQIQTAADALAGAAIKFDGVNFEGIAEGLQETIATGVAVGPFAEIIERTGSDLERFNEKLGSATTEAQKQQYVLKWLAKSGLKDVHDSYVQNNADLVAAEKAQFRYNDAMAKVGAAVEPINTALATMGAAIMEQLAPVIEDIVQWVLDNLPLVAPIVLGIASAMGVLSSTLAIQGLIKGVTAAFALLNTTMLANPIVLIIAAIASLVAAFIHLWKTSEEFRDFWIGLWDVVQEAVSNAWQIISKFFTTTVPKLVTKIANYFKALPEKIGSAISGAVTTVKTWGTNVLNTFKTNVTNVINNIVNWFKALPGKIGSAISGAVTTVKTWGTNVFNAFKTSITDTITNIVSWFEALPGKIGSAISEAVTTVKTWGINVFNAFKTSITDTITNIVNWFKALPGKIADAISGAVKAVAQWGADMIAKGKEAASKLVSAVVNGVASLPRKMLDAGKNLVSGLWNGISSSLQWIKDKISGWVGNVMDFIKRLFGIRSPSSWAEKKVGLMIGRGAANGITKSRKYVQSAMRGLRDAAGGDPVSGMAGGGHKGGGIGGGKTIIINQTNNSPRALSRREIYRQTHNALAAAGGV